MDGRKFDGLVKSLSMETTRRGVLGGTIAALATVVTGRAAASKVTICHFTGSASNPYNIITISTSALNQHVANHGDFVYTNCCLNSECSGLTNQCNVGVCNKGTCVAVPQTGAACNDGDLCTTGDVCTSAGVCAGAKLDCSKFSDACNVGTCNAADGTCFASPANDGALCDDLNACTGPDTCSGGVCSGPPISCDDGDDCTEDSCDPDLGCINTPIDDCDGGNQPCDAFVCGYGSCASRPSASPPDCFCFERADAPGTGLCVGNYYCGTTGGCSTDSDCASGYTCTINTCCGPQGECAPPCPDEFSITSEIESQQGGATAGGN